MTDFDAEKIARELCERLRLPTDGPARVLSVAALRSAYAAGARDMRERSAKEIESLHCIGDNPHATCALDAAESFVRALAIEGE